MLFGSFLSGAHAISKHFSIAIRHCSITGCEFFGAYNHCGLTTVSSAAEDLEF